MYDISTNEFLVNNYMKLVFLFKFSVRMYNLYDKT